MAEAGKRAASEVGASPLRPSSQEQRKRSRWEQPAPEPELAQRLLHASGWPLDVLQDPGKQPRTVGSAQEFVHELFFGDHLDEIVVLKNGVHLLNQADAVPQPIVDAAKGASTVRAFLSGLGEEQLSTHNGRIYYLGDVEEKGLDQVRKNKAGEECANLQQKLAAVNELEEAGDASMYIAELRRTTKFRHPRDNHWAKTALTQDVKDYVGVERAELMPYWDRYDEGVFVGGAGSGSAMHVDQIGWSNIGKNWTGHKLVAIWPYGAASNRALDSHLDVLFVRPSAPFG